MKNLVHNTVRFFLAMVLTFTWTLAVSSARAEDPMVPYELPGPPEKAEEPPATFGPLVTDTAVPLDKGKFAIQPTFGMAFVTNNLTTSWRRTSPGGNFYSFGMDWKLTYGLIDNMEIFVVIPYVYNWSTDVDVPWPMNRSAHSGGLADINLTAKYRLVEETKTWPTVTALFATDFPSGRFKNLNPNLLGMDIIGGGAYVFTTGINVSKWVKPFIFYGNVWYSMQTAFTDDDGRQYPRDFVTVNLAAEYPITGKWIALLEFTSYWDGGRLFGHKANTPASALMAIVPGIEYMYTDKLSFALGVSIDLAGKNNSGAVTPLFSFCYQF